MKEPSDGTFPPYYIIHNKILTRNRKSRRNGLLAISPLWLLIILFVACGILGKATEQMMVLIFAATTCFAACIMRGVSGKDRLRSFLRGATHRDLRLMVWIFLLAGFFSGTAKAMGAVDATVQLTLQILPPDLILAGMYLSACFISLSMGTSVGTIVALVPVATSMAEHSTFSLPLVVAAVVGGALFGDNLSFISDTTVVATRTQGCRMKDKFRVNIRIVLPAALLTCAIYLLLGRGQGSQLMPGTVNLWLVLPYLAVLLLALCGVRVLIVLSVGCLLTGGVGILTGTYSPWLWIAAGMAGVEGMLCLIAISILAGGLLALIGKGGGITYLLHHITRRIHSRRGAEATIAGMVSVTNLCTANNTIAILSVGQLAHTISQRFGVDPRKSASLLDTFSCCIQGIIPYGAQLLMAAGLSGIGPFDIIPYLYYPVLMGLTALLAIWWRFPKQFS